MKSPSSTETARVLEDGGRILVTRLLHLGDVILTLPSADALRSRFPRAEVDYLSRGLGADILLGDDRFGRVYRLPERSEGHMAMWRLIRELRRRRYTVVVDLYSNPRSALLSLLTGAPVRIGGARRVRRHCYTHAISVPPAVRSATEVHQAHLEPLGVKGEPGKPSLPLHPRERARAREVLGTLRGRSGTRRVGIHPGGKWEVKRWPAGSFLALAERLIDAHGMQPVVFCGPDEEVYRRPLRDRLGDEVVFYPTSPIRDTAAAIAELDGMIVCDGGVMHLSIAVGVPTVGIFGSAEPEIWFPYESFGPYRAAYVPITCRPCHQHTCDHLSCLHRLTVDRVEAKLIEVLNFDQSVSVR